MAFGDSGVVRAVGRLRDRARRNVRLWESFFDANQPWREHGPLRWREAHGTWVLDGETSPERLPAQTRRGARRGGKAARTDAANTAETATRTHRAR
ncbi:hypothetical protein LO772_05845 [Yinghuangia sp. ASG 101]|uniref:hypothetical protein n=1 Tax=Yinghuangia sp. ASG 101 TaxID=2896848 RepID=UPI001E32DC71|nr:hypothetical protein [Yinghuangia sp. ASG 101]UGQ13139.1 hypothetical protein LO772_05845 [Yinghuangia sp. ASG 101]